MVNTKVALTAKEMAVPAILMLSLWRVGAEIGKIPARLMAAGHFPVMVAASVGIIQTRQGVVEPVVTLALAALGKLGLALLRQQVMVAAAVAVRGALVPGDHPALVVGLDY